MQYDWHWQEDVGSAKQVLEGWNMGIKRWFKKKNGFITLSNHWIDVYFW